MKQRSIAIIVLLVSTVAIIISFYFYNRANTPTNSTIQEILTTKDEQLTKGDAAAPVKIVEFADILCPYCAKTNRETIPDIETNYIKTGKVQLEVRLTAIIAPDSKRAAEGAYCAAEQNKFWEYLDTAYDRTWNEYYSKDISPEDVPLFTQANIRSFVKGTSIDLLRWQGCMDKATYASTIAANQQQMQEIKAYGTPHFVINEKNYNGAPPYSAFKAVIEAELKK